MPAHKSEVNLRAFDRGRGAVREHLG